MQLNAFLLFPEKEAKSVCSASQKIMGLQTSREAEPRKLNLSKVN
jgi:hypothetical protein